MNTIVICGQVSSISAPQSAKAPTTAMVNCSHRDNVFDLKLTLWGQQGVTFQQLSEGDFVIVEGSLHADVVTVNGRKTTTGYTVNVNNYYPVAAPVAINSVTMIGRIGQDPEVKYFESGNAKATFTLAVRKGKDQTDWFNVSAWSKDAEFIANYASKGRQISLKGSFSIRTYQKDGETREWAEITADNFGIQLIDKKGDAVPAQSHAYDDADAIPA